MVEYQYKTITNIFRVDQGDESKAKSFVIFEIWKEIKVKMPRIKITKMITAVIEAITWGNFNLVLKKTTTGFNKIANKTAINKGTIMAWAI